MNKSNRDMTRPAQHCVDSPRITKTYWADGHHLQTKLNDKLLGRIKAMNDAERGTVESWADVQARADAKQARRDMIAAAHKRSLQK